MTFRELEPLERCKERRRDAKMATRCRYPAYPDTAVAPHLWQSSGTPIRVDGNGHSLDIKGRFLHCHDVLRTASLRLCSDRHSVAKESKGLEDQLADKLTFGEALEMLTILR